MARHAAASHEWEGLSIDELTDAAWQSLHASVAEVHAPAGIRHPLARSTRSEAYYYCVNGSVAFEVEGRRDVLHAGDLLIVELNEWYRYEALEESALVAFSAPAYDPASYEFRADDQ